VEDADAFECGGPERGADEFRGNLYRDVVLRVEDSPDCVENSESLDGNVLNCTEVLVCEETEKDGDEKRGETVGRLAQRCEGEQPSDDDDVKSPVPLQRV